MKKEKEPLPPLDLHQRYTLDEASAYLRMSKTYLYRKIKDGSLIVIRDSGRTYVAGQEIARLSGSDGLIARYDKLLDLLVERLADEEKE